MKLVELNDFLVNGQYKETFIDNGLVDFYSIYNYHCDNYFTKNPLRDVISFSLNRNIIFLKRHRERYWIWPRGSSPAKREWDNIDILNKSGFRTMEPVAYGQKVPKINTRYSFIITKKIEGAVSLEDYISDTFKKEEYSTKQKLIKNMAEFAKRFHDMGYCHQDFYAGHIFLARPDGLRKDEIYLIDVQRLLKKKRLRSRWRIKDIAQLNYSVSRDIISNTARVRFLRYYFGISKFDRRARVFIKRVQRKTRMISRHTQNLILKGRFNY